MAEAASKNPDAALRESWSKASRLTLSGTVALFLLTRGAKAGANKIFEILGLDWSSLNAFAVALFGVPVVAGLCVWSLWWARTFARRHADKPWFARVVTKTDAAQTPEKGRTLATWSLILYVALPMVGLGALEAKFLSPFSYSTTGSFSCPKDCEPETGTYAHFWPAHGLPDIFETPYRFEGNLTYVPVWQPFLWLVMGLGVLTYAVLYLRLVFRFRKPQVRGVAPPAPASSRP